jgi:hypothetical protein
MATATPIAVWELLKTKHAITIQPGNLTAGHLPTEMKMKSHKNLYMSVSSRLIYRNTKLEATQMSFSRRMVSQRVVQRLLFSNKMIQRNKANK